MKKTFNQPVLNLNVLLFFCLFVQYSFGQVQTDSTAIINREDTLVFTIVENMPSYIGDEKKLIDFLNANFKGNCEGKKSFFQLEVAKDSTVSRVRYLRKDSECDDEIVSLLKQTSGNWIPGKQNGHVCNVYQTITVRYLKGNKVNVGIGIERQLR